MTAPMTTLREVVDFTGVEGPAGQMPGAGSRLVGLRAAGDLVAAVVPDDQRRSLRALAAALPTLPPVPLEARIAQHADEVTPSRPIIEVDVPRAAVVETVIDFFSGGVLQTPESSAVRLVDGQRVDGALFAAAVFTAPGEYEAVVRRVGVSSSGVVALERRLPFRVRAVPPPPPPPTPPAPPSPPTPAPTRTPVCGVELAGSQPFGGVTNVRVFGAGFLPGDDLVVLEDGGTAAALAADAIGSFSVVIGLLETTTPREHVFQAVSTTSGARSNKAGFTV